MPEQRRIAESYIAQLNQAHAFPRPIATRVEPLKGFYPAEGYHQDYLVHHPDALYIAYNDLPKVENFKRTFPDLYNAACPCSRAPSNEPLEVGPSRSCVDQRFESARHRR